MPLKSIVLALALLAVTASVGFAAEMPSGMSRACQDQYAKYKAYKGPKAFAKGRNWGCGWSAGTDHSLGEHKGRALEFCSKHTTTCVIVEQSAK